MVDTEYSVEGAVAGVPFVSWPIAERHGERSLQFSGSFYRQFRVHTASTFRLRCNKLPFSAAGSLLESSSSERRPLGKSVQGSALAADELDCQRRFAVLVPQQGEDALKIRSRWLNRLGAHLVVLAFRLLFRTVRVDFRLEDPSMASRFRDAKIPSLFCVWHDGIVVPIFAPRGTRIAAALVSRHQDGGFLADVLDIVGVKPIRGSASRGGALSMRQMLRAAENLHIVITPDGPRGPRRTMKDGIVFLASRTGRQIIPCAYTATRSWRIRGNWTNLMIPKPFSTVYYIAAAPVDVPRTASRAELERSMQFIQQEMDRMHVIADALESGQEPPAFEHKAAA